MLRGHRIPLQIIQVSNSARSPDRSGGAGSVRAVPLESAGLRSDLIITERRAGTFRSYMYHSGSYFIYLENIVTFLWAGQEVRITYKFQASLDVMMKFSYTYLDSFSTFCKIITSYSEISSSSHVRDERNQGTCQFYPFRILTFRHRSQSTTPVYTYMLGEHGIPLQTVQVEIPAGPLDRVGGADGQ